MIQRSGEEKHRLLPLDFDHFEGGRDGNAAKARRNADHELLAIANLLQPARSTRHLTEGHILRFRPMLDEIIDHRRAEKSSTASVRPERAFEVHREQRKRFTLGEFLPNALMHGYVDKRVLNGGHVGTYFGTT